MEAKLVQIPIFEKPNEMVHICRNTKVMKITYEKKDDDMYRIRVYMARGLDFSYDRTEDEFDVELEFLKELLEIEIP